MCYDTHCIHYLSRTLRKYVVTLRTLSYLISRVHAQIAGYRITFMNLCTILYMVSYRPTGISLDTLYTESFTGIFYWVSFFFLHSIAMKLNCDNAAYRFDRDDWICCPQFWRYFRSITDNDWEWYYCPIHGSIPYSHCILLAMSEVLLPPMDSIPYCHMSDYTGTHSVIISIEYLFSLEVFCGRF